jgi:oligoendopeptidase F
MAGYRVRQKRISDGLCADCGEARGIRGTATQCRKHADERNRKQARRLAKIRTYRRENNLCIECGERLVRRKATLCQVHKYKQSLADKAQRNRKPHRRDSV